jgi:hypothetical protein
LPLPELVVMIPTSPRGSSRTASQLNDVETQAELRKLADEYVVRAAGVLGDLLGGPLQLPWR